MGDRFSPGLRAWRVAGVSKVRRRKSFVMVGALLRLCTHLAECNFCLICSVVWVHSLDFLQRGSSALLVGILFTICRSTYAPDSRTCCHSARGAHPILRRLRC